MNLLRRHPKPDAWPLRPGDLPPEWILRREPRLRGLEENPYFRRLVQLRRRGMLKSFLRHVLSPSERWFGHFLVEDIWLSEITPEQMAAAGIGYLVSGSGRRKIAKALLVAGILSTAFLTRLSPYPWTPWLWIEGAALMAAAAWRTGMQITPSGFIQIRSQAVSLVGAPKSERKGPGGGWTKTRAWIALTICMLIIMTLLLGAAPFLVIAGDRLAIRLHLISHTFSFWLCASLLSWGYGFSLAIAYSILARRRRDKHFDNLVRGYRWQIARKLERLDKPKGGGPR